MIVSRSFRSSADTSAALESALNWGHSYSVPSLVSRTAYGIRSRVPIVSSGFGPICSQRPTGSGSSPKPKSERKLFESTTSRRGSYSPLSAAARIADRVSATGPGSPSADDVVASEPPLLADREVSDSRDAVLGLEVGSVVLLEDDPALTKGRDNRLEVGNAEARHRPAALARRDARVDHQRAATGGELGFAVLGKIVPADHQIQPQDVPVELHGPVDLRNRDDRSTLCAAQHVATLSALGPCRWAQPGPALTSRIAKGRPPVPRARPPPRRA